MRYCFARATLSLVFAFTAQAASVETLRVALRDSDPAVRSNALQEAASLGSGAGALLTETIPSLRDNDVYLRYYAVRAVRAMQLCSDAALQALGDAMRDTSIDVRAEAIGGAADCVHSGASAVGAVDAALQDPEESVRSAAIEGIGKLGPLAAKSIPRLLAIAQKEPARREAVFSALSGLFDWPDESRKSITSEIASRIPEADGEKSAAVRVLLVALTDPRVSIRRAASNALKSVPASMLASEADPEQLLALPKDRDEDVRYNSVALLTHLAEAKRFDDAELSAASWQGVAALLEDSTEPVRFAAAEALRGTTPVDLGANAFLGALDDASGRVRSSIIYKLAAYGGRNDVAVEVAARAKDASPEVREAVASALGDIGRAQPAVALGALTALASDSVVMIRMEAAESIGSVLSAQARLRYQRREEPWLSDDHVAALDVVVGMLGDETWDVRNRAVGALEEVAPLAPLRLEPLRTALRDRSANVRSAATLTLQSYGIAAAPAAADIVRLLDDPIADVRVDAARTLGYIGADPASTVPALRTALIAAVSGDTESTEKTALLEALGRFGPAAEVVLPDIILHSENLLQFQEALLGTMRRIGPKALAAVDAELARMPAKPRPQGLAGLFPTHREELGIFAEKLRKVTTTRPYEAIDFNGAPVTLEVTAERPIVAVATWCGHSSDFKRVVEMPLIRDYVRKAGLRLLVDDEESVVRNVLEERERNGKLTPEERDAFLRSLARGPNNTRLASGEFLEGWREVTYAPAAGSPRPKSFPTLFDVSENEFGGDEMDWLRSVGIPPKVISLAQELSRQEK